MLGWPGVVLFAVVAGGAGLVGVWLMWRHERWARRHTGQLVTFASGLLVSGSLLHLLARAEAMAGAGPAMGWALAAFVGLYVAENHFLPHPHSRSEEGPRARASEAQGPRTQAERQVDAHARRPRVGAAAVLGLGLHSLLDGIAVGAGFSASWLTGGVIVSLVVSHKLPVGIASMGVLYHSGLARGRAVRYSSAVALLTPVAVVTSYALLRAAPPSLLGGLVAAAGGSFLYVGAADLLPEGQASGVGKNTVLFLLGVAVMVGVLVAFPGGAGS